MEDAFNLDGGESRLAEVRQAEQQEVQGALTKSSGLLRKLGLAAICMIPPADVALSDSLFTKLYAVTGEHIHATSALAEHSIQSAIVAAVMIAEAVVLNTVVSRSKELQGISNDFQDYMTEKQSHMSGARLIRSKIVNSPLKGFEKIHDKLEPRAQRAKNRESKLGQLTGQVFLDTVKANTLGTAGVALEETMEGNPPSLSRNIWLGTDVAAFWLGGATALGKLNDVPYVNVPLNALGKAFEVCTTVNPSDLVSTPVGTTVVFVATAILGTTGWRLASFHENRQQNASPEIDGAAQENDDAIQLPGGGMRLQLEP